MSFYADLHVHSRFSRATSKRCVLEWLDYWAQLKGLRVVGTGDFTHPEWLDHLRSRLEQTESGLYRLNRAVADPTDTVPPSCAADVLFMPTAEISSIYKRAGVVRKVHTIVVAPDLDVAGKIQQALARIGNVASDGRPILGLDPRDLLEIVMGASADAFVIPAHIWTPWFSMLGSKSGFDSADECFGEYVRHIFAVETGLSSDPAMNWRVSGLDRFTLVSNSDCHSPDKLARECNVFHCAATYKEIRNALRSGDSAQFGGTIEFFPEEGKYHLDGHRACDCCMTPEETRRANGLCPQCGKPVTVGVLSRVEELADRPEGGKPVRAPRFQSLIGLCEVLGEILATGSSSKKVMKEYHTLLEKYGPELGIQCEVEPAKLARSTVPRLGDAITRMRQGTVFTHGGYDGEYGTIRVFAPDGAATRRVRTTIPANATSPRLPRAKKKKRQLELELD